MSLTTRVALWLAGLWLLAVAVALGLGIWASGDALRAQWADLNRAVAVDIAAALSRVPAEPEARSQAAATRFERGDLLWLSLRGPQRATLFERRRVTASPGGLAESAVPAGAGSSPEAAGPPPAASANATGAAPSGDAAAPSGAASGTAFGTASGATEAASSPPVPLRAAQPGPPEWFASLLPTAGPMSAPLRPGGGTAAPMEVSVVADAAHLQRLAWRAFARFALLALGGGAVLVLLAGLLWGRWRRMLRGTVAQAQALERLQFVEAAEPRWPELRDLTRAMNAVVRRLREQVVAQAEQVAQLQRQVQTDPVTGLPRRDLFLSRLSDVLGDARLPAASLLLVRVPELVAMNERHGRDVADRLLVAVADVLFTYVERIAGAVAGRLTGQDFALVLPAAGAARETAMAIEAAVAAAPASRLPGVRIVVAGCDGLRGLAVGAALAAADAALARAEEAGDCVVADLTELGATGARAWAPSRSSTRRASCCTWSARCGCRWRSAASSWWRGAGWPSPRAPGSRRWWTCRP